MINGSNDYIIGGVTKIKNYQKEEVSAAASVEEGNKFVITITGGKNGTVKMTRFIKDGKLHVEQVLSRSKRLNYFFKFLHNQLSFTLYSDSILVSRLVCLVS